MVTKVDEFHTYNKNNSANNHLITPFYPNCVVKNESNMQTLKIEFHAIKHKSVLLHRLFQKVPGFIAQQCILIDLVFWNSLLCRVAFSHNKVNPALQDLIGLKFAIVFF